MVIVGVINNDTNYGYAMGDKQNKTKQTATMKTKLLALTITPAVVIAARVALACGNGGGACASDEAGGCKNMGATCDTNVTPGCVCSPNPTFSTCGCQNPN